MMTSIFVILMGCSGMSSFLRTFDQDFDNDQFYLPLAKDQGLCMCIAACICWFITHITLICEDISTKVAEKTCLEMLLTQPIA